jgi:hypothetical protein
MDVDAIYDEQSNSRAHERYFVWSALGYRLMQLAARMGNEGLHRFGAEAISLLLAIGYTSVPGGGKGQDPVRRDEKTKSVVKKCRPTRPANKPSNQTNQPVKQKTSSGPGWGAKNLLKRRAELGNLFLTGLIFRRNRLAFNYRIRP